jgi:quinolinate synthase
MIESIAETFTAMKARLHGVVPEIELRYKAELVFRINKLKATRSVVVLGHNYMEPALFHTIPDHVGDSLELCRIAATSSAETILFCGVRFMAETAKILNPDKTVLLPSLEAGCSLASSITASDVLELRRQYPEAPVVCYINSTASVKAESDVCCTSSNARAVVESLDSDSIILIPDEFLAANVARETNRCFVRFGPDQGSGHCHPNTPTIIGWAGQCEVHERFSTADVRNIRAQYPDVAVLAHPECKPEVVELCDFTGSTSAMARYVEEHAAPCFALLTECCMGDNVAAGNPTKDLVRMCSIRCPHMNSITLEDTLSAMENNAHVIDVPEPVRSRARKAIDRMLNVSSVSARN